MTLDKLPVYSWAMLVFAVMIVFGFPAVILGTALLEIERSFHWPFFIAEKGGDPLLWQHLFWFFGHPDVYIIFLPAAGFVSMILPTMCGTKLVAYRWVVLALVATGFIAFGVWVHHMFATGLPKLSLSFFAAASMAVAVPSGIQVFAWIATMAKGKLRLTVPALFVLGFLAIFTLGGLTGVMVAIVPFDWQTHDTFFVVAHFHYVLIGGMVFPLFAAFYYWAPTASRTALSECLGRWCFGLMFVGFNVAFFPQHVAGLMGMPRRVWTYPAELGWGWLNMTSTIGAFILGLGALVFLIDLARNFRPFTGNNAGNVWNAGTLEWLPGGNYATRSIPIVTSLEPLWEQPNLARDVDEGRYYLPNAPTGQRETIVTSAITAEPQYLMQMPGPGWPTVLAAWFTAAFFLLLTVKLVVPALICGVVAVGMVVRWMWDTDPGPAHPPVHIGGGIHLPVNCSGPQSHSWWAVVVLILVSGTVFASLLFSYFFLWTVSPDVWPEATGQPLPEWRWPAGAALLLVCSSGLVWWAGRRLAADAHWRMRLGLVLAALALAAALACELAGQRSTGLSPVDSSYGAVVYMTAALQGLFVATLALMALYTLARSLFGLLHRRRRATFDNTMLLWHYAVGQGLVALVVVHVGPRVL